MNVLAMAPSRVVTQSFFLGALQLAIARAQRQRQCVSVIGLTPDTRAAQRGAPGEALTRLATSIGRRIRATDVIFVRPPDALFLMLVDADPTAWSGIVARLVGGEYGGVPGIDTRTPRWSIGGSYYPSSGPDPNELLSQASHLMTMARRDGGNRLYTPD